MSGYNILIPDVCRDVSPEITLPVMDALQTLEHTPVVMELASIGAMYRQMRYERHGCYDIFAFYMKDLLKNYNVDFGVSIGLGVVLEDQNKQESHNLLEEAGIPNLIYLASREPQIVAKLNSINAMEWEHTYFACSTRRLTDILSSQGMKRVAHCLPGTNRRIFFPADDPPGNAPYPVKPNDSRLAQDYDVSFVGSYGRKRETYLKALADAEISLAIFGDQRWKEAEGLAKFYRGEARYLTDLNTIYNASKISVDLPHDQCVFPDYTSNRLFDCLASGGFLITHEHEGLDLVVEPGKDVAVFDDEVSLVRLVQYYLAEDLERHTTSSRGHIRISSQASWVNRLSQLLPQLEMHLLTAA